MSSVPKNELLLVTAGSVKMAAAAVVTGTSYKLLKEN